MIDIPIEIKQAIANHAREVFPQEACGFVVNGKIIKCKNDHPLPLSNFAITAKDYAKAERLGTIEAIYHSHPEGLNGFSSRDVQSCRQSNVPWIVFNAKTGDFFYADPSGNAAYEGRQWIYGIHDCYAILKDFYQREFAIALDDFPRGEELEWEKDEWRMFERHYEQQGFVPIDKPANKGDFLLMQVGAPSPNHAGVIAEDGWSFYHHLMNRRSEKTVYGGYWAKITTKILRHKELL
jgi:proteasome lid subunit RPN8/RPN11